LRHFIITIELSSVMSDFVADLFLKSLNTGDVPQDWKLANVLSRG